MRNHAENQMAQAEAVEGNLKQLLAPLNYFKTTFVNICQNCKFYFAAHVNCNQSCAPTLQLS